MQTLEKPGNKYLACSSHTRPRPHTRTETDFIWKGLDCIVGMLKEINWCHRFGARGNYFERVLCKLIDYMCREEGSSVDCFPSEHTHERAHAQYCVFMFS